MITKLMKKLTLSLTLLFSLILISCAATTKPNWFDRQVFDISTSQVPHIIVRTNTEWITNTVPVFLEREVVRVVTNDVGSLTIITNVQVITNFWVETKAYTNFVVQTNFIPNYSYETKPGTSEGVSTATGIINTIAPGWGGVFGILLTGGIGIYKHFKNRKTQKALIQGLETTREVVKILSPDPTSTDAKLKDYLIEQQKSEGVQSDISGLIDKGATDRPAAKEAAKDIVTEAATDTARIRTLNAVPPTPGVVPPPPPIRPV